MRTTVEDTRRASASRYGYARREQRRTARLRPIRTPRPRPRSAGPARRAASAGSHAIELAAPHGIEQRRALDELVARQRKEPRLGRPPTEWLARPARCRNVAIERGVPSWQTSSTSPMSMPSSSDAVATSAAARRSSAAARRRAAAPCARLPWCAVDVVRCRGARTDAAPTRSAMRRVLTKTSVVRCSCGSCGKPVRRPAATPRRT